MKEQIDETLEESTGIKSINISDEMRTSFLDYAMSVIASRALPDARDGLKPVHRRIMYAMNDLGITADKAHKKSARIVGEVIGKYHPHGDSSVYETMVRMAQDFSYRHMLVDGHGNFGSIDGDSAAAMRYTEARMSKIAMELVKDIHKDTIDYKENYDGQEKEPVVLPARFPNLLVNGATGIAVGMATNIPPHNLSEVIDGILALARNPEITISELREFIKGPDFPTGGEILGTSGIKSAFETGNGAVKMRGKAMIETMSNGRERIVITEIPYQVNKAKLVTKIVELVRNNVINGISDLRDETNRVGMRVVIELKKAANANVVLNKLFKLTPLQSSFGVNMLALVGVKPRVLTLKECLKVYLDHQITVIRRRTQFDLDKAEARAHILEGLTLALSNIDDIINIIKKAEDTNVAQNKLMSNYQMSEKQAKAILDMKLSRLTGLERDKIENELKDLNLLISELKEILESREKIIDIIEDELLVVKEKYGEPRRSQIIIGADDEIDDEDLIKEEDVVIAVTNTGYCKRIPLDEYKVQNRGGVGSRSMKTNDDDYVEHLLLTSTHSDVLFFTNQGKVYRLRAHQIPEMSKTAKGIPVVNLIQIENGERVEAIVRVDEYTENTYLLFATKNGLVKLTKAVEYARIRQTGKIAIILNMNDELVAVRAVTFTDEVILGNENGKAIRFPVSEIRAAGRKSSGVRGMNVDGGKIVGMSIASEEKYLLSISANGYGKMTAIDQYRLTKRGGKGVKSINVTEKTGNLVKIRSVSGLEQLLIITTEGIAVRTELKQISISGRGSMGVKIISTKGDSEVATISVIKDTEGLSAEAKGEHAPQRELSKDEIESTQLLDASMINEESEEDEE